MEREVDRVPTFLDMEKRVGKEVVNGVYWKKTTTLWHLQHWRSNHPKKTKSKLGVMKCLIIKWARMMWCNREEDLKLELEFLKDQFI